MKISVLIPCYNATKTIEATLASVFAQTVQPDEIIVLNDGSTDNTLARLESYKNRIVVLSQKNGGAANARNQLVHSARGDIIAFLDSDDLWHPAYLETQQRLVEAYPQAVAYFTCHDDFVGYGHYFFRGDLLLQPLNPEIIRPEAFIVEYNKRPMRFQMSCLCMPRKVLAKIEGPPFGGADGGDTFWSEDTYFHNLLPLLGPVVHTLLPLAAYRLAGPSLSSNQLKWSSGGVAAFKKLAIHYRHSKDWRLCRAFKSVSTSQKRIYGKFLMDAGNVSEARIQFESAVCETTHLPSLAKSLGLLSLSWLPVFLQTRYPLKALWSGPRKRWRVQSGK